MIKYRPHHRLTFPGCPVQKGIEVRYKAVPEFNCGAGAFLNLFTKGPWFLISGTLTGMGPAIRIKGSLEYLSFI
jgi:hypothetical protein